MKPCVLLLTFLLFGSCLGPDKSPNVILISIDTFRADHLGCYKYTLPITPNIDQFSLDCVLFQDVQAQAPSTTPSHASIFTALIPSHHGAYFTRDTGIDPRAITIGEIFKAYGYHTVSFNDGGQLDQRFGFDRGFDIYHSVDDYIRRPLSEFVFDKRVAEVETWMGYKGDRPYLLFLHSYQIHHPYTPLWEDLEFIEQGTYHGSLPAGGTPVNLIQDINSGKTEITEEDLRHITNTYDAEILDMDRAFGRLIRLLKKKGEYDNSMIILTSDHGEAFGEHGLTATHSSSLHRELLHVPLLIKFPGGRWKGKMIRELVRSVDILPTILDYLRIQYDPEGLDGFSIIPVLKGESMPSLIAISQIDDKKTYGCGLWTVRAGHWKLLCGAIYDQEEDPKELNPLCIQDRRDMLRNMALSEIVNNPLDLITEGKSLAKEKAEAVLKALGYTK